MGRLKRLGHVLIFVVVSYIVIGTVAGYADILGNGGKLHYAPKIIAAFAAFGPFGIVNAIVYVMRRRQ